MGILNNDSLVGAISLARYSKLIGYTECAFFGVRKDGDPNYECSDIWSKEQRDTVQRYLWEAQEDIEGVTNYPISPKYLTDEQIVYGCNVLTKFGKLIDFGIQAFQTIGTGVAVSHATDPATITLATALTSIDGVNIYYPGTTQEILASAITIAAGVMTIRIPRCRMVRYDLQDNPVTGIDYTVLTDFQQTVDVKREYTDQSSQGSLVFPHPSTGCPSCSLQEYDACVTILDKEIGNIRAQRATWDAASSSWTAVNYACQCGVPFAVKVNYKAGLTAMQPIAESALIRLAHSKMPTEPCGCQVTQRLWKRDREAPTVLSVDRLECPFGVSAGAWNAWKFANSIALIRTSTMSRKLRYV
jgi:hypothetical protein